MLVLMLGILFTREFYRHILNSSFPPHFVQSPTNFQLTGQNDLILILKDQDSLRNSHCNTHSPGEVTERLKTNQAIETKPLGMPRFLKIHPKPSRTRCVGGDYLQRMGLALFIIAKHTKTKLLGFFSSIILYRFDPSFSSISLDTLPLFMPR